MKTSGKRLARPEGFKTPTLGSEETIAVSVDSARNLPQLAPLQMIMPADSILRNCAKVPQMRLKPTPSKCLSGRWLQKVVLKHKD